MIPEGYRPFTGKASPAVQAKAVELLSQDYGYQETVDIDGKNLLFVVEEHTWYGADPTKPSTPHKGVTVYEAIVDSSFNEDTVYPKAIAMGIGLGVGWLLLKHFRG